MIIEIEKYIKFIEQNKNEKYYAKLHILKILSKNKIHLYKILKKIIDEWESLQELNTHKIFFKKNLYPKKG